MSVFFKSIGVFVACVSGGVTFALQRSVVFTIVCFSDNISAQQVVALFQHRSKFFLVFVNYRKQLLCLFCYGVFVDEVVYSAKGKACNSQHRPANDGRQTVCVQKHKTHSAAKHQSGKNTENECEDANGVTKPYVLHAEANAITKIARSNNSSDGATMYVTASPCIECAKLIIQAGIKRVVYSEKYRLEDGLDLLKRANIEVIYINPNE